MRQRVTATINTVRSALSPTEYRTTREIMSITGLSWNTVYQAIVTLDYRGEIEVRQSPISKTGVKLEYRRIIPLSH